MSVATKNPFALLDEDGSRPSSPPPKKEEAPAPAAPARNAPKNRGGPASRGGKYYARGGAKSSGTGDANPNQDGIQDPASPDRKFDGRGRGRGGRGAGRGGRGRPFDRQSQTGKTDSDKKIHQGWGGDDGQTELKQEEAAVTDAVAEEWGGAATADAGDWGVPASSGDGWAAPAADAAPAAATTPTDKPQGDKPARREREPEEEDNTLTLDQYLAQQKEKELELVPKLETRKVAGGDWKDAVLLQKPEEEEAYFSGKAKPSAKPRTKKEEKVFLEIDARFERPQRGGRGRGRGEARGRGEGRGRGGGNRGAARGAAPASVNVDDESAFPSLS